MLQSSGASAGVEPAFSVSGGLASSAPAARDASPLASQLYPSSAASSRCRAPALPNPPVAGTGSVQLTIPTSPLLTEGAAGLGPYYSAPEPVGGFLWRLSISSCFDESGPQLSVYLECLGEAAHERAAGCVTDSCGAFIADGVAEVRVVPYSTRGRAVVKALPFQLTEHSSKAGFDELMPSSPCSSPVSEAIAKHSAVPAGQVCRRTKSPWRVWTDFELGLVDGEGNVCVCVDFVVHTRNYGRLAALVDRSFSLDFSVERDWLSFISAVREEPSLLQRCVGGPTPLTLALKAGKIDYALLLLSLGAYPGGYDPSAGGVPALHTAVEGGSVCLVSLLISRYGARVEERDSSGETCVFRVALLPQYSQRKSMLVLLKKEHRASLNVVNYSGTQACDLLAEELRDFENSGTN